MRDAAKRTMPLGSQDASNKLAEGSQRRGLQGNRTLGTSIKQKIESHMREAQQLQRWQAGATANLSQAVGKHALLAKSTKYATNSRRSAGVCLLRAVNSREK